MADALYLELPEKKGKSKMRLPRFWLGAGAAAALLLLAAGILLWLWLGRTGSAWGVLDGMVYAVSPEFPGKLESLHVREGDRVSAGQKLGNLDVSGYDRHLREAAREVAALRPPDMPEMAARLKEAQDSEREMVNRLAKARADEEAGRRHQESCVMEHVRAQLALRGMDSQGGERVVGKSRYQAALNAEAAARARMEEAKADFEQVSRIRAALDQELGRIRDEVLAARQLASRNRYAARTSARDGRSSATRPDGALVAPISGRVLRVGVSPGQMVQGGEPVLLLLPDGAESDQAVWVQAYFAMEAQGKIRKGQKCAVRTRDGVSAAGIVAEIFEPQPLPGGEALAAVRERGGVADASTRFLPVRVSLDGSPDGLYPGGAAECYVKTRSFLGFSGF